MTLCSVGLQFVNQWFLSKGKLEYSYPLTIAVYVCCIFLESFIAIRDPNQISLLLFIPMYVWAIIMSFKGLKRLKTTKESNKEDLNVV